MGRLSILLMLAFPSLVLGLGCKRSSNQTQPGDSLMSIELTSPAFQPGTAIPKQYTGDGADRSPPLGWSEPPPGTKGLALICDDPDAPRGTWVHWVLFNIPADTRELPETVPPEKLTRAGARQGTNDFGKLGYGGPLPPPGKPHRYYFKIYALDSTLDLKEGATKQQVLKAM